MSQVEIFRKIQEKVQDGSIKNCSLKELKEMRHELLTETPRSNNPKFIQIWKRVESAVSHEIESKSGDRKFKIQIFLSAITILLILINIYLTHGS